jgi:hypothetical protein
VKWSGQDYVKKVGTYALGRVTLNTVACLGMNIGAFGHHANPRYYQERGFDRTVAYPDAVKLQFPEPGELSRMHKAESAILRDRVVDAGASRPAQD